MSKCIYVVFSGFQLFGLAEVEPVVRLDRLGDDAVVFG